MSRVKRCDHITPVLTSLHRLSVFFRTDFNILLIHFRVLHGMALAIFVTF